MSLAPGQTSSSSSSSGNAGVGTIPRLTKFSMPHFNIKDDPETWFSAAEQIFHSQFIQSEQEKYGFLLQSLTIQDITNIRDIVNSCTIDDKYTQAKNRLISRYGQSEEDKVRKLLEGAYVHTNTMPSVILHELRQLTDASESVLRGIWLKKLPERIQEGIAAWTKKSLAEQAEVADLLYKAHNGTSNPPTVAAVTANDPRMDTRIDSLFALVQTLQVQVAALTSERNSRSRSRSPSFQKYHTRTRSQSRYKPKVINGVCTYHYKFKERAYKCMPGCKFNQRSEN